MRLENVPSVTVAWRVAGPVLSLGRGNQLPQAADLGCHDYAQLCGT